MLRRLLAAEQAVKVQFMGADSALVILDASVSHMAGISASIKLIVTTENGPERRMIFYPEVWTLKRAMHNEWLMCYIPDTGVK